MHLVHENLLENNIPKKLQNAETLIKWSSKKNVLRRRGPPLLRTKISVLVILIWRPHILPKISNTSMFLYSPITVSSRKHKSSAYNTYNNYKYSWLSEIPRSPLFSNTDRSSSINIVKKNRLSTHLCRTPMMNEVLWYGTIRCSNSAPYFKDESLRTTAVDRVCPSSCWKP